MIKITIFQLSSWDCALEFWVWSSWCKGCEAQNSIQILNSSLKP